MTTAPAVSLPMIAAGVDVAAAWDRLRPLRPYLVLAVALFLVTLVAVVVRLQVQSLEIDLDHNDRAQRQATVLNERLELELRARRRLQAVQGYAAQIQATPEATIVRVGGSR
jgi:sensor domain CHASE-containing protein